MWYEHSTALHLVRVNAKSVLRDFWERHPDSERALRAWYEEAKAAPWKDPAQVKARYLSASILRGDRVVFDICGNRYRLVVKIAHRTGSSTYASSTCTQSTTLSTPRLSRRRALQPKVIKNETEYRQALQRIDELFDSEVGTPEADELETWVILTEVRYPLPDPAPRPGRRHPPRPAASRAVVLRRLASRRPSPLLVAEQRPRLGPVLLGVVLEDHVHLVLSRLGESDDYVGDLLGQAALLVDAAAFDHLHYDERHPNLLVVVWPSTA
jgi:mRNA interferase HigB